MLDLISTIADLAYIGLLAVAFYYARGSASLRDLNTAMSLYLLAALVQSVSLSADVVDVDSDGWVPVVISALTLAAVLGVTWFAARRMNRMGGNR